MREFNTSGPCDPELHYTIIRKALIAEGAEKVKKGRYFTLFAPRQAGKTTYFKQLMQALQTTYTPIWISFEYLSTVSKSRFYESFEEQLKTQLQKQGIESNVLKIDDSVTLASLFAKQEATKPIVLIIDEFEGIPEVVLGEVMHTFRQIYHQKENYNLHSLILVGVSTVAELVVSQASPFNVTEELQVPYFTHEEVAELIKQYVAESGQTFENTVIEAIYANTRGQPGLVCALCSYLVEKLAVERQQPVTMAHFYRTQQHFLTERFDKNILNIVRKAREKRRFMLKLLFGNEPVPFTVDDPDIAWLYANGVIDKANGYVDILVPLYAKRLINAFRPLINGEMQHYITSHTETVSQYLTVTGGLNINALLDAYRAYVRRRGFRAFDTEQLKEAAWHYSLDGFIHFFIECLEGQTFIEVPSGRGRTDILILHRNQKYIIETKIFTNRHYFQKGKGQLAAYLQSENLEEGYYAVFSNMHTEQDALFFEEMVQEKRIYTHIIPTVFEEPSRVAMSIELKLTEAEKIAINSLKIQKMTYEEIAQITGVSVKRVQQLADLFNGVD